MSKTLLRHQRQTWLNRKAHPPSFIHQKFASSYSLPSLIPIAHQHIVANLDQQRKWRSHEYLSFWTHPPPWRRSPNKKQNPSNSPESKPQPYTRCVDAQNRKCRLTNSKNSLVKVHMDASTKVVNCLHEIWWLSRLWILIIWITRCIVIWRMNPSRILYMRSRRWVWQKRLGRRISTCSLRLSRFIPSCGLFANTVQEVV
jgi:hypothetical protein